MRNLHDRITEAVSQHLDSIIPADKADYLNFLVSINHVPQQVIIPSMAWEAGTSANPEGEEAIIFFTSVVITLLHDTGTMNVVAGGSMPLMEVNLETIQHCLDVLWERITVQLMELAMTEHQEETPGIFEQIMQEAPEVSESSERPLESPESPWEGPSFP